VSDRRRWNKKGSRVGCEGSLRLIRSSTEIGTQILGGRN
jgi:hypothetical protein